jgi:predicted Zn-dependent protease
LIGPLVCALSISGCASYLPPIGTGEGVFVPEVEERGLWVEGEKESGVLLERVRAYDDPLVGKYLIHMLERLTPTTVLEAGLAWRVEVLRDPTLNVLAMPDGRAFVHTGLLAAVRSEAQLALVLARAVAEVIHRQAFSASLDGRIVPITHEGVTTLSPTAAVILGRKLPLSAAASITGYGGRLERQADAVGLALLAGAGWDPAEAATVWELLATDDRGPLETFLLGRPAWLRERGESAQDLLRNSEAVAAPDAVKTTREFELHLRPVVRDNAAEDIRAERFALAARALDRVLAGAPADALAHLSYGDLRRLQSQRAAAAEARASAAQQAEAHYARAIELDPALAAPHRQLGLLYYAQNDIARARVALETYLALAPTAPDAARIAEYVRELGR